MSKQEEILHKLSTGDRNYIKEKIKNLKESHKNQSQIAIEKLKKLKDDISFYAEDNNKEIRFVVNVIIKKIDNQIKELKGE